MGKLDVTLPDGVEWEREIHVLLCIHPGFLAALATLARAIILHDKKGFARSPQSTPRDEILRNADKQQ
jgi:hypothetical protein